MMIVIMLGMGASLTWRDFLIAFRKPKGVLVGLLCQYGIMPLLAFLLAKALGLSPGLTVG
jgi:predicted Na+-dependent transporter